MRASTEGVMIWQQLLNAEAFRQDKRYFDAYKQFESVLGLPESVNPYIEQYLSEKQRRWAYAHCGTAAAEAFTPNGDNDYLLDVAKKWLELALNDGKAPYPWVLVQLGEVCRNKGNLSELWFNDDNPGVKSRVLELKLRNCSAEYEQGEKYFRSVAGSDEKGPGWVQAHLGALLINKRRYYKDNEERRSIPQEALNLLKNAASNQLGRSPWTNQYMSAAYFASAIEQLKLRALTGEALTHLLLSLEFSVMGWHTAPNLMRNPVQPGAIEIDATFTILYDLFDLLSTPTPAEGLKFDELVQALSILASALSAVPVEERHLIGASALRFKYVDLYVTYLARKDPPMRGWGTQIITSANQILEDARNIRLTTPGMGEGRSLSPELKNGFLLAVLTVMMTLLKTGAILKIHDLGDGLDLLGNIANELDIYSSLLPVLKQGGQNSIDEMARLYEIEGSPEAVGNRWLLSPLWAIGSAQQEDVLRRLLVIAPQPPEKKEQ